MQQTFRDIATLSVNYRLHLGETIKRIMETVSALQTRHSEMIERNFSVKQFIPNPVYKEGHGFEGCEAVCNPVITDIKSEVSWSFPYDYDSDLVIRLITHIDFEEGFKTGVTMPPLGIKLK